MEADTKEQGHAPVALGMLEHGAVSIASFRERSGGKEARKSRPVENGWTSPVFAGQSGGAGGGGGFLHYLLRAKTPI